MSLTTTTREYFELLDQLKKHKSDAQAEGERLTREIQKRKAVMNMEERGFDSEKVALAQTIILVSEYSQGGEDRQSVVNDAIRQFASGEPVQSPYVDLWYTRFATKNYDRWRGQRSDCGYGMCPRHGSICFSIGVLEEVRKRPQSSLTADEVEAVVYYLTNLGRIQAAAARALQEA